ncbi:hypothetical protein N836_08740 [Leptolyngbya sp. Heron Island J]|uniref:hypothetical protein n=1 Tax=Leptolyngbya sp. Heron Island J TaxID=1385935 RepID=UPI0003B9A113|nr:hypothetical protein [Leptolyngbya sp. Heron Island J]ESA36057.1 hypothetical protein N836_08740 [Leptolyngbya sp. Heron Island J]
MPSSSRPYKSKLLRFVLQQWQQGLERQDRAWRQLQSTTVWGAQVAVFPIYAIMRSLERARFVLGQSPTKSDQPTEPMTPAQGNVTDLEHSLTAILTHTQQLLSSEQRGQLAIAPKSSITRTAKHLLVTVVDRIRQQFPKRFQPARETAALAKSRYSSGQLTPNKRPQQKRGHLTTSGSADIHQGAQWGLAQNGTTLASSLKTRNLVVVNLKNEVFDILTPEQQQDLQHYIIRVMHAYQQSRTIVPRQPKQLSVKTILAIGGVFIAALPMELKKAWLQVAPGPELPDLPAPTSSPQPQSRIFYPQSSTPSTVKMRARHLQGDTVNGMDQVQQRLSSNSPDAFEANVNDVSYLEHPLEKILRWIDRVLTWCEHRWQQWLEHRANMG